MNAMNGNDAMKATKSCWWSTQIEHCMLLMNLNQMAFQITIWQLEYFTTWL
jgi:hypothetical protein